MGRGPARWVAAQGRLPDCDPGQRRCETTPALRTKCGPTGDAGASGGTIDDDLRTALQEEIARLPTKFRLPIVFCYLDGLTQAEAAAHLRCGEATVRRRLVVARQRLHARLARRGFASLSTSATLANAAGAVVPAGSAQATLQAVTRVAAGEALATVVGARVANLTQGGMTLITNGWKGTTLALLSLAALASLARGVGVRDVEKPAQTAKASGSPITESPVPKPSAVVDLAYPPRATKNTDTATTWPMTLAEAFQIALNNSDFVRVFAFNAQNLPTGGVGPARSDIAGTDRRSRSAALVIGRLDHDSFAWRFKSQVMAKLRSVERQYWCLVQAQAQRESSEQAARAGQEILDREKADLDSGRGTLADVAEASQRQEQFHLDLVTRTSDVITTEREFRDVLGLPQADNRRIVPATDPNAELVEFDWETCLGEMMYQQPEIVLHKLAVNELQPAATVPSSAQRQAAGSGRESSKVKDDVRENQRKERQDKLQQLVHAQTHALARSFLEVDANFKQYQTGKRLRGGEAATRCPA